MIWSARRNLYWQISVLKSCRIEKLRWASVEGSFMCGDLDIFVRRVVGSGGLVFINPQADSSAWRWSKIEHLFWGFLPDPRSETGVVGRTTSTGYGRLDEWQWEAVRHVKGNGVLCIRNTFMGFFGYQIKGVPRCSETAGINVTGWVNYAGHRGFSDDSSICSTWFLGISAILSHPRLRHQNC